MDTIKFTALPEQSNSMRESLRVLRNNIQFCGDDVKVILVTSTVPDEGKSTVAFNLARSFSESDKRVLLVDTDMRKSVLANRLHATNEKQNGIIYGLAHYLSGQKKLTESIYATDVYNLFVMFAGSNVPNATELLE
ncbi:MAG: CpsD/CapB family tyrosine-protein kinase, partial [Lachnospiraceae bacterium]|nr:CpsD/CapB family tyrosine-protein kinase [Lachnospiraceae bacterium]